VVWVQLLLSVLRIHLLGNFFPSFLSKSVFVSSVRCVSCMQQIVSSCFLIQAAILYILFKELRPLTFSINIERYIVFPVILMLLCCLLFFYSSLLIYFSSGIYFFLVFFWLHSPPLLSSFFLFSSSSFFLLLFSLLLLLLLPLPLLCAGFL
jgi:hypothetical protein